MLRRLKVCRKKHIMHPSWKICPTCLKPVVGWLLGTNGLYLGMDFPIREGKNTIGSLDKNDIVLKHTSISPEHAFIRNMNGDEFTLADLNSTKGTRVNGAQVHDAELIDNYPLQLGDLEFIFKCVPKFLLKR